MSIWILSFKITYVYSWLTVSSWVRLCLTVLLEGVIMNQSYCQQWAVCGNKTRFLFTYHTVALHHVVISSFNHKLISLLSKIVKACDSRRIVKVCIYLYFLPSLSLKLASSISFGISMFKIKLHSSSIKFLMNISYELPNYECLISERKAE